MAMSRLGAGAWPSSFPAYEFPYRGRMELEFTADGRAVVTPGSEEAAILGVEFATLLDLFGNAMTALVHLRDDNTGEFDNTTWLHMINRTEQLAARLGGIRDALVREYAALGGTYGQLAAAMAVSRSTAQYRRDRLTAAEPGEWERWAVGR
jgi:hypothetical protein